MYAPSPHWVSAHDGELDAVGCHEETATGNYHCHTGPLSGREFLSQDEAAEALAQLKAQQTLQKADEIFAANQSAPLKLLSWKFSSIGTKRFEYDRIVNVMMDADLVVAQEVEFTKTGESALTVIANLLSQRLNQRICKGWFKSETGDRGRHAFLWRDNAISFVEKNGVIIERCPEAPVVIRVDGKRLDSRAPYWATFFMKNRRQMINVASVQFEQRPKQHEVAGVFRKLNKLQWPVVLAGNFKIKAQTNAFSEATQMNFKPVLQREGNATSNLWLKNLSVAFSEAVDLSSRFPELSPKEVDRQVSSFPPLFAQITFTPAEAETLKTRIIRKAASVKKVAKKTKPKSEPTKKLLLPLPVHDDLEKEAD